MHTRTCDQKHVSRVRGKALAQHKAIKSQRRDSCHQRFGMHMLQQGTNCFDQGDAFFGHDIARVKSVRHFGKMQRLDLKRRVLDAPRPLRCVGGRAYAGGSHLGEGCDWSEGDHHDGELPRDSENKSEASDDADET
jgi:hypothetical protein